MTQVELDQLLDPHSTRTQRVNLLTRQSQTEPPINSPCKRIPDGQRHHSNHLKQKPKNQRNPGRCLPINRFGTYTNTIQFNTMLIQCYSFAMSMLWEQLRKTSTSTSLELDLAVGALSTMSHKAQRFTAIPMPVSTTYLTMPIFYGTEYR